MTQIYVFGKGNIIQPGENVECALPCNNLVMKEAAVEGGGSWSLELGQWCLKRSPATRTQTPPASKIKFPCRCIPDLAAQQVMSSQAPGQDAQQGQMDRMSLKETDDRILFAAAKDLMYLFLFN